MSALAIERLTRRRGEGVVYSAKMAAVKIWAGSLVATNSSGFAGPLTASTYATALLGVAEETVDNSGGSAGDLSIKIRRGCSFAFVNAGSNAVAQAHIGKVCGFIDSDTVNNVTTPSLTPGSVAEARIDEIDAITSEVWVHIN